MQRSFCYLLCSAKKKVTRRKRILGDINAITPWNKIIKRLEPPYPKDKEQARSRIGLEGMLRRYVVQQCFGLSGYRTLTKNTSQLYGCSLWSIG